MNIKIFCRCTCFLPGRAKDLSALLYSKCEMVMGYRHDIPQLIGRTFQTSEVKHIYIYITTVIIFIIKGKYNKYNKYNKLSITWNLE